MSHAPLTPEERFTALVEIFLDQPDVTPPAATPLSNSKFGSSGLKVHRKIFAMLVRGMLVVKLPRLRVDALVAAGAGERFDPRHDRRLMKEWVAIESTSEEDWLSLAREAMEFVAMGR